MEKLKIKIHPTFLIFAIILIYFGQGFLFVNYICVILLHELAHAFVARSLGYNLTSISLIPFGVRLDMSSFDLSPTDEIKIAVAGPVFNLFLCLVLFMIWWMFPETYNYTNLFFYANFVTCVFNLLPAFPLDGGRVLKGIFSLKTHKKVAIKICKAVNIFVIICLVVLFIFSIFYSINLTYLFVAFCVATGLVDKGSNRYTLIKFASQKKNKKVLKIKNLYVLCSEQLYKVYKFINNFSYVNLYVFDKNNRLLIVLSETEYISLCENFPATTTFEKVFLNMKNGKI